MRLLQIMPLIPQPPVKNSLDSKKTRHIYTVSEITQDIKIILENTFGEVWVEGEVSNFKAHPSGHFYFSLKDEQAILSAVMFSRANREIKFKIENGLKIICFGKIGVYAARGKYQLIVESMEPKGIGGLQLALEQLKQKLEKEGLFRQEHKRPIPYLPSCIGVVTSLSGAAIKDILKVLDRRFSDIRIIVNPARVQGEGAKEEIAQAIKDFNRLNEELSPQERVEVLIVGRGGGSIEDLWAFNEEMVAQAIYNSKIPIISAVGHERDVTIADLVADLRAPTPSVAAELVAPKKEDLREGLNDLRRRLSLTPCALIQQYKIKILDLARQIYVRTNHFIKLKQAELTKAIEKLSGLSPLNILSRGYSITFKMPQEEIVKDAKFIKVGDTIKTRLHKGEILSQIREVK